MDVQEAVDGVRMKWGFSTGPGWIASRARSSGFSADNFSAAELPVKSVTCVGHKQIHNSYCYC
jgi:hypothetical protein